MPRSFVSLFQTDLDLPDLQEMLADVELTMLEWRQNIMTLIIRDAVQYLKSYTSKKNPPRYPRRRYALTKDSVRIKLTVVQRKELQPDRPAHPGGWSDVTGPVDPDSLYAGYYGRVDTEGEAVTGVIGNRSSHAAFVEAKEGYFVVTGVFQPSGPVMKALRKYMKLYAPGTKVYNQLQGIEERAGKPISLIDSVVAR